MKKIFTLFAAMLVALTASAETWNITPERADTLKATIGRANNGDTILLAKGSASYTESATDIYKNLTIKAADMKNQPTVKAVALGISGDAAGVRVKFEGIKFDAQNAGEHLLFSYDATNSGNKLILEGCEFYGFTRNSSLINCGSAYKLDSLIVNNCYIYNITKSFIFIENTGTVNVKITNSTFANIATVTNSYYAGFIDSRAASGYLRVENCTFYNVQAMNTDYAAVGNKAVTISGSTVQNSIFVMPSNVDGVRAIRGVSYANNCLTYNYIKDGGGIYSSVTQNNCLKNVDPLFADTANLDLHLAETSPAKGAGVGGTHLGDPRWWPASWQPAADVPVTSITIDKQTLSLDVNETFYLHTTVLPDNASDPTVTWTSKNNSIATVTNGAVKGIAAGEVKIIAQAGEKTDTCTVTVSDAIPSTDFASSYFFMGTKAKLEGDIIVSEADSLTYPDKQIKGIASWKINALNGGVMQATANFKTGSASGAKLQIVILDANEKQVGDTLKQDRHDEDGDVAFPGSILLPKEGVYTVKLLNAQTWSHSKINGITLTKTADVPSIQVKGGWDSWLAPRNLTISDDGLSASVTLSLAADYDPEFKVLVNGEWRANGWWFKRNTEPTSENLDTDGNNMKIETDWDGDYTITWMFQTNTLGITFPAVPDPVFYVAGTFTDWETNKVEMTEDEGVCTASITLDANTDTYAYKILKIDAWGTKTWYGAENEGARIVYGNSTNWQLTTNGGGQNINLTSTLAGEYPFKFYAGTAKMDVEIPNPSGTAIDNTVVGEKAVKLMENGQLVIIKNGVRYNVLGTVIK